MFHFRRVSARSGLAAAVLTLIGVGVAAAVASQPDPYKRFHELVSNFPVPFADGGFVYRGRILKGDTAVGEFRFTATSSFAGPWRLEDRLTYDDGEHGWLQTGIAEVSQNLDPIQGSIELVAGNFRRLYEWHRDGEEIVVTMTQTGEDPVETRLPLPGPAITTTSGMILFGRLALPLKEEQFKAPSWSPAREEEEDELDSAESIETLTLTIGKVDQPSIDPWYLVAACIGDAQFVHEFKGRQNTWQGARLTDDDDELAIEYRVE